MKQKILTTILIPIIAIALVGVAAYFIDQQFNLGIVEMIQRKVAELSNSDSEVQNEEDGVPLEVEIANRQIVTLESNTSLTVISNKEIEIEESNKLKLLYVSERSGKKYYVLEIFNIGIGDASVPVKITDKSGNEKRFDINITRENYTLPFGLNQIDDWESSKYTVDGDNLLAKVDKSHKLVEDYSPSDLVDLNIDKLLYTNTTGIMLRSEAADYLALMLKALQEERGKNVVIASGYRSILNQYRQYASWVRQLGQEEADKVSARPGYSEHSLGTSVDFMSQDSGFEFTNEFDKTIAGQWLKENSHKYGFVQSYPEGKEPITGYNYEAWHYRYIGIENAKEFRESGLTLKEWLLAE